GRVGRGSGPVPPWRRRRGGTAAGRAGPRTGTARRVRTAPPGGPADALHPRGASGRDRGGLPERAVTDVVVLSLEPWDAVWPRTQYLVAGLLRDAPTLRVLFPEPAADPLHAARRGHIPRLGHGLRPAPPPPGIRPGALWLVQPTKLLPRRLDPRADARLAATVIRG